MTFRAAPRYTRGPASRAGVWLGDYVYALGLERRRARDAFDPATLESGDEVPIVLVPGVYETWEYLIPIGRALHERGHPVFAVPSLGRNLLPIPQASRLVTDRIAERGLSDVVFVAHSKGGLIGKQVLLGHGDAGDEVDHNEGRGRVIGVVAIATPFSGSSLSKLTVARPLREFIPGRGSLAELAREKRVNESIVSIYPEYDNHVPGGSELPGATNVSLPVTGHFRLLSEPLVIAEVLHFVEILGGAARVPR